jgi:glutathione S-transferase
MIQIWGRLNSANVQKVLWCCEELGLPFERIDAGMQYGRNKEPDYLAKNPNGKIPLLVDGDFALWESNSIMRYLAMEYGKDGALYPHSPRQRAGVDRWLDWQLSTLLPAEQPVFMGLVRTPAEQRDMEAILKAADAVAVHWGILDRQLEGRRFVEADAFTLADMALGVVARRWFGLEGLQRPSTPNLERWYAGLQEREGFRKYVAAPLS